MDRKCTDEVRKVRVGGPEWSTPMERARHHSAANAETHAHSSTRTHVLRLQAHTLARSLARWLAQQAGRRRQGEEAAGGPGEWGYDYNDSRDDELRRLRATALRCGGDLKRLLECITTF